MTLPTGVAGGVVPVAGLDDAAAAESPGLDGNGPSCARENKLTSQPTQSLPSADEHGEGTLTQANQHNPSRTHGGRTLRQGERSRSCQTHRPVHAHAHATFLASASATERRGADVAVMPRLCSRWSWV